MPRPRSRVTSPNGAENWDRALPHTIIWTDNIGGEVNSISIATMSRSRDWPATRRAMAVSCGRRTQHCTLGPGYRVRVTSVTAPSLADSSDATFTLSNDQYLFSDSFEATAVNPP